MRRLVVLMLSSVLLAAPPALGADAARIAGTTTIGAGQAGYVPVQLDQPLRIVLMSEERDEVVKVALDGGGPYAGMVLRLDDPSDKAPGIMSLRTPTFDHDFVSALGEPAEELGESRYAITLPAGRYRLYAIATGGPVAVKLTIPGMDGVADLRPTFSVPAIGEPLQRHDPLPTGNVVVAGQAHALTSPGIVAVELLTTAAAGVAEQVELCTYAPGSDSAAPDAFTPGCPGGEAWSELPYLLGSGYGMGTTRLAGPGEWGLGGNVEAAAVPAETVGYGLWLSFDGTPIPGAAIPDPPGAPPAPPAPPAPAAAPTPAPAPYTAASGGAAAGEAPVAKKPVKRRVKRRCPRVTRRSSRAQRRRAARCRAAQRRAAKRRRT